MFLSIFTATCRPENIIQFFDNLTQTANDPTSFEVLVKVDEGADDLYKLILDYQKTSAFTIKCLSLPKLDGYYSLDVGYNELLKIVNPDTYFCWLLTDEIRFQEKGWDDCLKKYIGFYPDDIFRLKLSIFQLKNHTDLFECLPCPDNYAVTTKRWLEVTSGWGHFWGPDSWHQCIDYYLSFCKNKFNPHGIWRSLPIYDIKVGGQEAGQGITSQAVLDERARKIWQGWQEYSTHTAQENYFKLAQRLNAHIFAYGVGLKEYILQENIFNKKLVLYDTHKKIRHRSFHYTLPKFQIRLFIGHKKIKIIHLFSWLIINRSRIIELQKKIIKSKRKVLSKLRDMRHYIHSTKIGQQLNNTMLVHLLKTARKFFRTRSKKNNHIDFRFDGKHFTQLDANTEVT